MPGGHVRDELIHYRYQFWKSHCEYVLSRLLLPNVQKIVERRMLSSGDGQEPAFWVVLIENRIDRMWLTAWLNSLLMMPPKTGLCFCSDDEGLGKIKAWFAREAWTFPSVKLLSLSPLLKGQPLAQRQALNQMMKHPGFWQMMPGERLLMIQTDALLLEPMPPGFMDYGYVGAPFLPGNLSEIYQERSPEGVLKGFFESRVYVHIPPPPDTYPFLHGNGGLSIRSARLMELIASDYGESSLPDENEDVFFSTHVAKYCDPVPLQIARAFAMETEFNPFAISCHAPWKYLKAAEQAAALDRHYSQVLACLDFPELPLS